MGFESSSISQVCGLRRGGCSSERLCLCLVPWRPAWARPWIPNPSPKRAPVAEHPDDSMDLSHLMGRHISRQGGRSRHNEHLLCAHRAIIHIVSLGNLVSCLTSKRLSASWRAPRMLWDLETSSLEEADCLARRIIDSWGTRSHSSKRRGQDQRVNGRD